MRDRDVKEDNLSAHNKGRKSEVTDIFDYFWQCRVLSTYFHIYIMVLYAYTFRVLKKHRSREINLRNVTYLIICLRNVTITFFYSLKIGFF
jgi:hypothetical protein